MDYDHDNDRLAVNEDRLNSLPDELIHQILSFTDTKFAVQTCLLSSRWELLWKSMPCLKFSSQEFDSLPKFANFVTNVLSRRNHQIEVYSVKLCFHEAACEVFVTQIANYAFSHNVQELTVVCQAKIHDEFPACLFSSESLKHFTLSGQFSNPCLAPNTPWDFPASTTLHLSHITFGDENTGDSIDLFSKCVNLKKLTLNYFFVDVVEIFDIITPRLENLMLIGGLFPNVINVIAPQLENLTIIDCSIVYLNAPPGLSCFVYRGDQPPQLPKECFYSLNKVSVKFCLSRLKRPYKEVDARETINMLQKLHSARFLTLNLDIIECLSSFPDLLSHLPSPFSNLISCYIDSSREEPYKVKISAETRNFLLENSPNATFITDLPEEPPTKAMIEKQAREKKRAKLIVDIENHMKELQALLEQVNKLAERKEAKGNAEVLENLVAELLVWRRKRIMQSESERAQIEEVLAGLVAQIKACMGEMQDPIEQESDDVVSVNSKKLQVRSLLEKLPKQQRAEMEEHYSHLLQQAETPCVRLVLGTLFSYENIDALVRDVSDNMSTFHDDSSNKLPLASQPSFSAFGC